MKKILFQGDSITDAGRWREDPDSLGTGYPLIVAAKLGYEHPGEYKFINRGISGNKSVDVAARKKEDIFDIAPDVMSLMVGVNDVWHGIDYNWWATCDDLVKSLDEIILCAKEANPDVRIMLLEPYIMKEYATESSAERPDKWETFVREVSERQRLTREAAERHSVVFVPLQALFDGATKGPGVKPFSEDGVHPTPAGHELIARAWIEAFEKL